MFIILAIICVVIGYYGGYWVDIQYRDEINLRRINLKYKWKNKFHFAWKSGTSVVFVALFMEIISLISAFIILICGSVFTIIGLHDTATLSAFIVLIINGWIYLCISIYVCVVSINHKLKNGNLVAISWTCEIEQLFRVTSTVKRKVKVISKQQGEDNVYLIKCGRVFSRCFLATTTPLYEPKIGEYSFAMYIPSGKYCFMLYFNLS